MKHEIYAVTNRRLCINDFERRISALCTSSISGIILREKDLAEQDYMSLSRAVMDICAKFYVPFIVNSNLRCARTLSVPRIQLPFNVFMSEDTSGFEQVIVSVHSVQEAVQAQEHGADMLITGHIFPTDCKKNLAPRGINFLRSVCLSVDIPVCAIGGITPDNAGQVISAGAAGVCVMSELMRCAAPKKTVREYHNALIRGT